MSGLGTSSNTTGQNINTTSNTAPWQPSQPDLTAELATAGRLANSTNVPATAQWNKAQSTAANLPNPGVAANQMGQSFMTGDPQNMLDPAYQQYQKTMNPIANMSADPTKNPATQQLNDYIRQQIQQSTDAQFAGAGRSLSPANTSADARAFTQAMAPTMFQQYNSNLGNIMNASQGLLGAGQSVSAQELANKQAGLQLASSAFPLSQLPAQTTQSAINAPIVNQGQLAGMAENLTIPIAGLGGTTAGVNIGTGQGTQTASPLTQMGQGVGLLSGLFGPMV